MRLKDCLIAENQKGLTVVKDAGKVDVVVFSEEENRKLKRILKVDLKELRIKTW